MLPAIQIIAIVQGIFLISVLFQKRQNYKETTFWLFQACLISVMLFAIGDDDYNLFVNDASWFFFHEPLMITFFFLFNRYSQTEKNRIIIDFLNPR